MPYILLETHPVGSMNTLDNTQGSISQLARDTVTGNLYAKFGGVWTQMNTNGAQGGNSASHAPTAVITNGQSIVLKKSDGTTTSAGNATLNSPATAVVSNGQLTNVRAGA